MRLGKDILLVAVVVLVGSAAVALPLFLSLFHVSIGAASIEQFVPLHLQDDFGTRVWLTYIYFLAAMIIHYLAAPTMGPKKKSLFLLGFAFFAAGNAIDLVYRAVQYEVVHFNWAAEYLKASSNEVRQGLAEKIRTFADVAPAISFSFALLFFVGRILMGVSLWVASNGLEKCASVTLIANGLWNILPHVSDSFAGFVAPYYLYPWLSSLAFVALLAVARVWLGSAAANCAPRPVPSKDVRP